VPARRRPPPCVLLWTLTRLTCPQEDGAGTRAAALEAVRRPHSSPTGAPAAAGAQ